MNLALHRSRPNCAPGYEVGIVLAQNCVQKLGSNRQTYLRYLQEQFARSAQSAVYLKALIEPRVIYQAFPSRNSTRLFKIHTHHKQQAVRKLNSYFLKPCCVFHSSHRIVDRARAYYGQEPIIGARDNCRNFSATLLHESADILGHRKFKLQHIRSN